MTNNEHLAEHEQRLAALKAEFEKSPRAYVARYGTVNCFESTYLVIWLLERIDRLEAMTPIRQVKQET